MCLISPDVFMICLVANRVIYTTRKLAVISPRFWSKLPYRSAKIAGRTGIYSFRGNILDAESGTRRCAIPMCVNLKLCYDKIRSALNVRS